MTEKQVQKQINDELVVFQSSKFQGVVPSGIIEKVKTCVMAISPFNHKIQIQQLSEIVNKQEIDLTNSEVEMVVRLILNTPPKDLYQSMESFFEEHKEIEDFAIIISATHSQEKERLNKKKNSLMNLGGVNGGSILQKTR